MKFSFRYAGPFLSKGGIKVDTKSGLYVYDTGDTPSTACSVLVSMCLKAHASAVVFTKKTDYYPIDFGYAGSWTETFMPKEMFDTASYPWIAGLSGAAMDSMTDVFTEAHLERSLIYLKGRTKSPPVFPRPGMAHCFYQLSDKGSKKDRLLTEALLTGLLTESFSRDEVRETVFFYDAPYRPQTAEALNAIITASNENTTLIGVYRDSGKGYDRGKYGFAIRNGKAYIKEGEKEREIHIPET